MACSRKFSNGAKVYLRDKVTGRSWERVTHREANTRKMVVGSNTSTKAGWVEGEKLGHW